VKFLGNEKAPEKAKDLHKKINDYLADGFFMPERNGVHHEELTKYARETITAVTPLMINLKEIASFQASHNYHSSKLQDVKIHWEEYQEALEAYKKLEWE
jgi:DNA-binding LytR/AlgR family response regulator